MLNADLNQAIDTIQQGGVLAYPTEAVWGLGCEPSNDAAIQTILSLKQRPWQKGLVMVAASWAQLEPWLLALDPADLAKVQATWPGPITWVLPCKEQVSKWLKGEHQSLAVRVTEHPLVRQLCEQVGPLVSTSANPAGAEPARSMVQVQEYFHGQLDFILPGELGGRAQPSEIRTLDGQRLR